MAGMPMLASADGAFLNVSLTVSNENGGTLAAKDFQYEIRYDGAVETLTGPIQAYDFKEHNDANPLSYSVYPKPRSGYTLRNGETGCTGEVAPRRLPLITCTIYAFDDQVPSDIAEFGAVGAVTEGIGTIPSLGSEMTTTEQEELIKSLLMQVIELLKQLIALKAQQ